MGKEPLIMPLSGHWLELDIGWRRM